MSWRNGSRSLDNKGNQQPEHEFCGRPVWKRRRLACARSTYCRSPLPRRNRRGIPAPRRTASAPEHTGRSSRRTPQGRTSSWLDREKEEWWLQHGESTAAARPRGYSPYPTRRPESGLVLREMTAFERIETGILFNYLLGHTEREAEHSYLFNLFFSFLLIKTRFEQPGCN